MAEGRPEQVVLSFGDNHAAGTVIRSHNTCLVLSVRHFLDMPERKVRVLTVGRAVPTSSDAVILKAPSGAQGEVDARLARLVDWPSECLYSLANIRDDIWSQMLRDNVNNGIFDSRLTVRLAAETQLTDLPIRLAESPNSDTFDFFIDPKASGRVPDRAGISGSGIYFEDELVGLVTGASPTVTDAFQAVRIEVIVNVLGLAKSEEASDEEALNRDDTPVAASGKNLIPPFVTECDEHAANPSDPARHPDVAGTVLKSLDPALAIEDCERAVQSFPGSSRLIYQLGRAYGSAYLADPSTHQFGPALDKLNEALSLGHLAAINNLESLLLRDSADCGGFESCIERYRRSLKVLAQWDPDDARIREASSKVYGDLAKKLCTDPAKCLADLAAAYEAVSPSAERYSNAQAQIAYLVLDRGLDRQCPNDPQCLAFMQQAFSRYSAKGIGWATNWMANLYSRYNAVPGACADEAACRKLAIAAWKIAGEQGDARSYYNLALKAEDESWQVDFGCSSPEECNILSFGYDEQAFENGQQKSAERLVWWLLFNQEAAGCFTQNECVSRAREIMDSPDFPDTAFTQRLRAQAILDHPLAFDGFCTAETCEAEAFRLFQESAEQGDAFAMGKLANLFHRVGYDPESNPAFSKAVGCSGELACTRKALEWSRKATEGGKSGWLDDWLMSIQQVLELERKDLPDADPETLLKGFQAEIDPWLAAAEKLAPGSNVWADAGFYMLLWDYSSTDGSICGPMQQRCQRHFSAVKSFVLQGAVTPEYIIDFASQFECGTDCDPDEIKILARAAVTRDSAALENLFDAAGLDSPICPLDNPNCPDGAVTTLRKIIPELTLAELDRLAYKLEYVADHSYGAAEWDWMISQLAAKGSATARGMQETRYLESLFAGGLSYSDISDNRARQVVEGLTDSLVPVEQIHNFPASCYRASHLVFMQNHSGLRALSVAEEADLLLFYMMICGDQGKKNGNTWLKGRSPELRVELQRRLGVPADGVFGAGSWTAAEALHSALLLAQGRAVSVLPEVVPAEPMVVVEPEVYVIEPETADQRLETWPPNELLSRSRAALLN